jgi:hypothetical protein
MSNMRKLGVWLVALLALFVTGHTGHQLRRPVPWPSRQNRRALP